MNLSLHLIGTSYKTSDLQHVARVQWREKQDITSFLSHVRAALGIEEIFFLQTCNRREFYFYAPKPLPAPAELPRRFREELVQSLGRELDGVHFYHHQNEEAATHLFRVASSMESMVLGETEIIKQIKDQSNASFRHANLGRRLKALVDVALRTSKRVRTQTSITKNVVSMASLIYRAVCDHVKSRARKRVVLVGAGHFITSILPAFAKSDDLELVFVNRTLPTALAEENGGMALSLKDFIENPMPFDAMVSATGAPEALFDEAWLKAHAGGALLVDAALPRDINEAAAALNGIVYMDLDSMNRTLEANRQAREDEIPKARPLFEDGWELLQSQWLEYDLGGYMREIATHYKGTGAKALSYLLKEELPNISEREEELLKNWTDTLVTKLMNVPILGLKGVARQLGPSAVDAYTSEVAGASSLFKASV